MAINWFNPNGGQPFDPSTFNYDTAAQKAQRQRAAAQALQTLGLQSNQGQFIKSGDFMGYAGGNTLGSTLAHLAAAALSIPANSEADDAQKQLGLDSQNALIRALDPNNSPAAQRGAAEQTQREAGAEKQREIERMNSTVQAGEYFDPQEQQGQTEVQTSPVSVPRLSDIKPMPMTDGAKQAVTKALASPRTAASAGASGMRSGQAVPVAGGPQSFGSGADLSRTLAPKTNLPVNASGPLSGDDIALAAKYLGNASGTSPNVSQATPVTNSAPALPGASTQAPATPQAPIQPLPPQAPSLEDRARAVGIDPTAERGPGDPSLAQQVQEVEAVTKQLASGEQPQTDSRSMVDQARDQGNANASYADKIAALHQIARTAPMGRTLLTR